MTTTTDIPWYGKFMVSPSTLNRYVRRGIIVWFVASALAVVVYALTHQGGYTGDRTAKTVWWSFYGSSLSLMAFGLTKNRAGLENVIYLITLLGEIIFPGLCTYIITQRLGTGAAAGLHIETACHLVLTLMSSLLLCCWCFVLIWKCMSDGRTAWWVKAYLSLTGVGSAIVLVVWPNIPTLNFIDPTALQQHRYIPWVYPAMDDINMSYARAGLSLATLLLPFVRSKIEQSETSLL